MKVRQNSKVQRARFHIGVQLRAEVRTSVDSGMQKCEIELTSAGVLIKLGLPWGDKFIPFSNVTEVDMVREENLE